MRFRIIKQATKARLINVARISFHVILRIHLSSLYKWAFPLFNDTVVTKLYGIWWYVINFLSKSPSFRWHIGLSPSSSSLARTMSIIHTNINWNITSLVFPIGNNARLRYFWYKKLIQTFPIISIILIMIR